MKRTYSLAVALLLLCGLFALPVEAQTLRSGAPSILPPYVAAAYPGTELIFAIPATGERPMTWSVSGLPEGLSFDAGQGIIRGTVAEPGNYSVTVTARNRSGKDRRKLALKIGGELAQTPVMGWNSWYTFGGNVSEEVLLRRADAMVESGMRDVGYNYICIDDRWQLRDRSADGHMVPDPERFPRGIRYVADYLHERGLHLGIYSDAAPLTCGRMCGSLGYEQTDAKDFAEWGVDLLKYDYCCAPDNRDTAIVRYTVMGDALQASGRSIVCSICEWGDRQAWEWGRSVGGHSWRTTGDVHDTWHCTTPGFLGIGDIFALNERHADHAGPGSWNDPDMLMAGIYGRSVNTNEGADKFGCTQDEYRTQMSLWCMMASPLLCSTDIAEMDEPTREILLNPEIIAIAQDMLGRQGRIVKREGACSFWVKPLSDGMAVAVYNAGETAVDVTVDLPALGVPKGRVRDVWAHRDLGRKSTFPLTVGTHGCEVFVVR